MCTWLRRRRRCTTTGPSTCRGRTATSPRSSSTSCTTPSPRPRPTTTADSPAGCWRSTAPRSPGMPPGATAAVPSQHGRRKSDPGARGVGRRAPGRLRRSRPAVRTRDRPVAVRARRQGAIHRARDGPGRRPGRLFRQAGAVPRSSARWMRWYYPTDPGFGPAAGAAVFSRPVMVAVK